MSTGRHRWQEDGSCAGLDPKWFFEQYEEDPLVRPIVDNLCMQCPVRRTCFGNGFVTDDNGNKTWGVWGGVYFTDGEIDPELNAHKDWDNIYEALTNEV
jgi:hypothetical protein